MKRAKYIGTEKPMLKNKNIALLFEKDSTRTRCAFEVAAHDQGAHVTYLGPTGSQMGKKKLLKIQHVYLVVCMMVLSTEVSLNVP